jgi:hypothetical protein
MVALRALVLDPGRVSQFGKRLLSRAHRAAGSTCKNFFLKTPLALCLRQKKFLQAKRSVRATPCAERRSPRFSTLRRGMQFEGERRKRDKT